MGARCGQTPFCGCERTLSEPSPAQAAQTQTSVGPRRNSSRASRRGLFAHRLSHVRQLLQDDEPARAQEGRGPPRKGAAPPPGPAHRAIPPRGRGRGFGTEREPVPIPWPRQSLPRLRRTSTRMPMVPGDGRQACFSPRLCHTREHRRLPRRRRDRRAFAQHLRVGERGRQRGRQKQRERESVWAARRRRAAQNWRRGFFNYTDAGAAQTSRTKLESGGASLSV
mmetsp:Transcript_7680/g.25443  ORF Transcript_7680/g.25443 Transcript_7680/m.25443 type:complete len:224 (+) Transcript_7680:137-808(+)